MITVIAVGKQHDALLREAIGRYEKRLKKPFDIKWVLIPHSSRTGPSAAQDESERIEKRIEFNAFVVLLDERGDIVDSPSLAAKVETALSDAKKLTFVIGGAYGVTPEFRQKADFVWSLSKLVFPHQMVRLLLSEQLYRAQSIIRGEPYHHE